MSKAEMLRQSAEARNQTRLSELASQVQTVRDAKVQSAEELSAILEPLAQALAALSEDAGKTLLEIDRKTEESSADFKRQLDQATKSMKDAIAQANQATASLKQAANRFGWTHYLLAMALGLSTAGLVSAFWLWYRPPTVETLLNPKAVAEYLKPAVIEALKPSKGK